MRRCCRGENLIDSLRSQSVRLRSADVVGHYAAEVATLRAGCQEKSVLPTIEWLLALGFIRPPALPDRIEHRDQPQEHKGTIDELDDPLA